jgi:hypothetical protein
MKLILDDRREMPGGAYNCVRTYEECIDFLRLFKKFSFISLDYCLESAHTGYDVLAYMAENSVQVEQINTHSDDSNGVAKMRKFAQEHFPNVTLTFNPL